MGFIPVSVWCAVNEDNAVFDQGLCAHQLIIGCIVDYINYSGFAGTACKNKRNLFLKSKKPERYKNLGVHKNRPSHTVQDLYKFYFII